MKVLAARLEEDLRASGFYIKRSPCADQSSEQLTVFAKEDTWTRKARRLKARGGTKQKQNDSLPVVGVRITVRKLEGKAVTQMLFAWIFGRDRQLFDSLCMSIRNRILNKEN